MGRVQDMRSKATARLTSREARRLRADARWRGRQAYDEFVKRVLVPTIEAPSEIAPRYRSVTRRESMVAMRDGVRLATDVYLPSDPLDGGQQPSQTGLPAVVTRQPYGKREAFLCMPILGRYWARRGYACVVQDVRGRWASEGEYDPFIHEVDDGYDTVDWVAKQPWCDGSVGVMGESYFGYTTWAMAVGGHPAVKAACPGDTTTDMYTSAFRNGALCLNPFGVWALWINGERFCNYYRFDPYCLPLRDLDETCGLGSRPWKMLMEHFPKDDYWGLLDLTDRLKDVAIPVLQWSGWYDQFLDETIKHWRLMRQLRAAAGSRKRGEGARDQFLVIGATDHMLGPERSGKIGRVPVAGIGKSYDRACRFFDRYLKGAETSFPSAPVTYFTLGRDEWHTADDWPPKGTKEFTLFPASGPSDGALTGRGALVPEAPGGVDTMTYTYDPADPLDAWVGTDGWAPAAAMRDRAPFADRADVLAFDSPPLAADFEITGPIRLKLRAATDAQGTDFIATLDDVHPDGYAHLVQQGIVRARYRDEGRDEPVEPGAVVDYDIDLWSASYVVKSGHRIRLEISSSEFDRFDRNLNVYLPWGTATTLRTARQTVHLGGDAPTRLVLSGPRPPRFREGGGLT